MLCWVQREASSVVWVKGQTVMIVLLLPFAWTLALENLLRLIHLRRLGWSAPTVCMTCAGDKALFLYGPMNTMYSTYVLRF
jgi:hypothetical protein